MGDTRAKQIGGTEFARIVVRQVKQVLIDKLSQYGDLSIWHAQAEHFKHIVSDLLSMRNRLCHDCSFLAVC
jgi:hypothetical protein